MSNLRFLNAAIGIALSLAFCGCKKHEASNGAVSPAIVQAAAPNVAVTPAATITTAANPGSTVASAQAPGSVVASTATPSSNETFSLDQVPFTSRPLPPFPYLSFPDTLPVTQRYVEAVPFDEVYVIAGSSLRRLEGNYSSRWFSHSSANMSPLASRRNYHAALEAIGAVKVNKVTPNDPALVAAEGGDEKKLEKKLRMNMGSDCRAEYETYLIRSTAGNIWFALAVCEGDTRLLTLQEQPLRQSVTPLSGQGVSSAGSYEPNAAAPKTAGR